MRLLPVKIIKNCIEKKCVFLAFKRCWNTKNCKYKDKMEEYKNEYGCVCNRRIRDKDQS